MLLGCGRKTLGLIGLLYWLVFHLDAYSRQFLLVEHLNKFITIRIIKGNKVVKFWYDEDTIQTAELPYSSDIINEFTNVFFE